MGRQIWLPKALKQNLPTAVRKSSQQSVPAALPGSPAALPRSINVSPGPTWSLGAERTVKFLCRGLFSDEKNLYIPLSQEHPSERLLPWNVIGVYKSKPWQKRRGQNKTRRWKDADKITEVRKAAPQAQGNSGIFQVLEDKHVFCKQFSDLKHTQRKLGTLPVVFLVYLIWYFPPNFSSRF